MILNRKQDSGVIAKPVERRFFSTKFVMLKTSQVDMFWTGVTMAINRQPGCTLAFRLSSTFATHPAC